MENSVSAVSQNLSPGSSISPPTSYYGIHGNRKSRALTAMKLADRCCCVISNSGAWPTPLSRFDARGTFGHLGEIRTVRLLRRQLLVRFASEEACAEAMKWCDAQRGLSAEFGYTRYCRNFIRDGACRRKRCRLRHSFVQSLDDVIADPKAETASRRGLAAQQKLSAQSKSLTTRRANEPTKTIGAAHALETLPRLAQDLGLPQLLHHAHANQAFGLFGAIQHSRIISNDHVASSDIRSPVFVKYNTPTSAEHGFHRGQARLPAVLQCAIGTTAPTYIAERAPRRLWTPTRPRTSRPPKLCENDQWAIAQCQQQCLQRHSAQRAADRHQQYGDDHGYDEGCCGAMFDLESLDATVDTIIDQLHVSSGDSGNGGGSCGGRSSRSMSMSGSSAVSWASSINSLSEQ